MARTIMLERMKPVHLHIHRDGLYYAMKFPAINTQMNLVVKGKTGI
jgi:hypothetical protein